MDINAATVVYQWLREVCSAKLVSTPIKLGGGSVVVQVVGVTHAAQTQGMHK